MTDYLKIGRASELSGRDYRFYRFLESLPGILSLGTLLVLTILAYFKPTWVAYFMIAFDTYWLIQVLYMAIYLIASYRHVQRNNKINWPERCSLLNQNTPKLPASAKASLRIHCATHSPQTCFRPVPTSAACSPYSATRTSLRLRFTHT